jgi:2-dehydropantoate 2-reductase
MRNNGLKIESPLGNLHLKNLNLTDDASTIGSVDIVLFCVKLWDIDNAAQLIKPLLNSNTAVYSFQNGIYAEDRLCELLGSQHVIGGYASTPAMVVEPGLVRQFGTFAPLEFGELDNTRTPRVEALLYACKKAGIDAKIALDIQAALWSKFILITTHSGATALCRTTEGPIRSDPWGRKLLTNLATEALAVAHAKGINLPTDYADQVIEIIDGFPADSQASLATDVQRGLRLELEWLSGLVVKIGAELGVPTPSHEAVMMGLHMHIPGHITKK